MSNNNEYLLSHVFFIPRSYNRTITITTNNKNNSRKKTEKLKNIWNIFLNITAVVVVAAACAVVVKYEKKIWQIFWYAC